jgi:nucleoside-diphosphate-sugar epimerase
MSLLHRPNLPCAPDQIDNFLSGPGMGAVEAASSMAAPVGVLGAGGKMGLHVAAMLRKALDRAGRPEVPVSAVSRFGSVNSREEFARFGVDTIAADLLDARALEALPDMGTVFFLAGIKFGTGNDPDALRRFNEEMPAMVAQRFRSSVSVVLSTGCVYPFVPIDSNGSSEEDKPAPTGDYAVSCRGRELAYEKVSREAGAPAVLIRLNYSVEFRYGVLVDIAQKVLSGLPVDVSTGRVNAIWQRDAVDQIIRSSAVATSPAVPLNVTGSPALSVRAVAEEFGRLLGREAVITGREEESAWLSNPARAHALFGAPEVNARQMMGWIAAWLLAGGGTHGKPTKFENRDGKF